MVKYYLNSGDGEGSEMFSPYIWGKSGFGDLMNMLLSKDIYGSDLELLLIQYYVEGKFSRYLPEEPKVGNYSRKNKDIAVAIGVPCHLFHIKNEFERKEFIVDSTLSAIMLVKNRLEKKKLDINFSALIKDIKELSFEYHHLKYPL